jgi:hypothetical protein
VISPPVCVCGLCVQLLSVPGHPTVAPLRGCMQDDKCLYIVTDFYDGGDLLERVMATKRDVKAR